MTARAAFEKDCHAALARYKQAVAEGTYRVVADNTLVDALLKAWEQSLRNLARREYAHRGVPAAITSPEAAAARLRELYGDTADEQAARRADLDIYGARRRA